MAQRPHAQQGQDAGTKIKDALDDAFAVILQDGVGQFDTMAMQEHTAELEARLEAADHRAQKAEARALELQGMLRTRESEEGRGERRGAPPARLHPVHVLRQKNQLQVQRKQLADAREQMIQLQKYADGMKAQNEALSGGGENVPPPPVSAY